MNPTCSIRPLNITTMSAGGSDTVHPTLLWDKGGAVLIDTGFPRQFAQLRAEIERAGVSVDRLQLVLMTHQDIDHIGCLPELVEANKSLQVLAHEIEKPYIQGDLGLLRVTPEAIARIDAMPDSVPEAFRKSLKALLLHPPRATVNRTLSDGESLPLCGGITTVETPGHTPGHLSFYHRASKTLIAGDALTAKDGELYGPVPELCLDLEKAEASVTKFTDLDIETVICYHGGIVQGDIAARLARIMKR